MRLNALRACAILLTMTLNVAAFAGERVETKNGAVEGTTEQDGIRVFRGIPFAQPPIGELRWKEPQRVKNWDGVLQTKAFGPRCMQAPIFGEWVFARTG